MTDLHSSIKFSLCLILIMPLLPCDSFFLNGLGAHDLVSCWDFSCMKRVTDELVALPQAAFGRPPAFSADLPGDRVCFD